MKNTWFEWGVGVAAAALMGAGLIVAGVSARPVEAAAVPEAAANPRLLVAAFTSADQLEPAAREMKRVSVKRNETLSAVLDRLGAPREEANAAVYAAGQLFDLRSMQPGDDVTAWLETNPTDGAVSLVGVSLRPGAERQVVGWRTRNGMFELRVEDEGHGLPDPANLFVPFFTTKPSGSGIGLALSRQIAEAHGGALSLENRRGGRGAEARLRLPV